MRDDKIDQIQFIEAHGYRLIQTEPTSFLDVITFDSTSFSDLMNNVAHMGIQIHSAGYLRDIDPHWLRKLWDLQWAVRCPIRVKIRIMS